MENHQNLSGIFQTTHRVTPFYSPTSTGIGHKSNIWMGILFVDSMIHKYILKKAFLYPNGKNVPVFGLPAVPAVFPKPKWW